MPEAILIDRFDRLEAHWVDDDRWTACGLRIQTLAIVDRLQLDELGGGVCCSKCATIRARPVFTQPTSAFVSSPRPGRLIKAGPLYHGARSTYRGDLLPADD